jgi:hypothetical protein
MDNVIFMLIIADGENGASPLKKAPLCKHFKSLRLSAIWALPPIYPVTVSYALTFVPLNARCFGMQLKAEKPGHYLDHFFHIIPFVFGEYHPIGDKSLSGWM